MANISDLSATILTQTDVVYSHVGRVRVATYSFKTNLFKNESGEKNSKSTTKKWLLRRLSTAFYIGEIRVVDDSQSRIVRHAICVSG